MKKKKDQLKWPREYEAPRVFHVRTSYQQALGVSYCSPLGSTAGGGSGSCSAGESATGTPDQPNACKPGNAARIGPGGGSSSCGPGHGACANG